MCWGRQTFCMGHTCGLVGFSGALLSGFLRSGCWTFTSKVWFFAEDISSPFRAIVPNVCLLSTFSEKERERQCVGNDHRPSLSACCGWKKKIHSGSKEKKFFLCTLQWHFWRCLFAPCTLIWGLRSRAVRSCPQGLLRVLIMPIRTDFPALRGDTVSLSARYRRC